MKRSITLLMIGLACMIYGGTTWAQGGGGGNPNSGLGYTCSTKTITNACPEVKPCRSYQGQMMSNCNGQTRFVNRYSSPGTMNGYCYDMRHPNDTCPADFSCESQYWNLNAGQNCLDEVPTCEGTIAIQGC